MTIPFVTVRSWYVSGYSRFPCATYEGGTIVQLTFLELHCRFPNNPKEHHLGCIVMVTGGLDGPCDCGGRVPETIPICANFICHGAGFMYTYQRENLILHIKTRGDPELWCA
jgi:hypothetical protein